VLRRILLIVSPFLIVVGAVAIIMGFVARSRLNPTSVKWGNAHYNVVRRTEGEAIVFDIRAPDGTVAESLFGTTDLLCDPPFLMFIDVDGDGVPDVYHHHCGGHGYLRYKAERSALEYVNLGQWDPEDAPAVTSFWGEEITGGGFRLFGSGTGSVIAGFVGLAWLSWLIRARGPARSERL
jgi:hypothetical protein